ncbi:MAG: hypothetical protein WAT39_03980 [Planctomycetota bacterium]
MTPRDSVVWQVTAGSAGRSYADDFFRYGVALLGPGDPGPWASTRDDDEYSGSFVRRFASEAAPGEIIVLRAGRSRLLAVGLLADDYLHAESFGDVLGWDLQHVRRVRWFPLPTPHDFDEPVFGANPARFGQVQNPVVRDYAAQILDAPLDAWQRAPLPPLPPDEPDLRSPPACLQHHLALVHDLLPIWGDPNAFGLPPSEHEIVAHLVIPFFQAMGWRTEHLGVEWQRVDVAVFDGLPRGASTCRFVVEAKPRGRPIEDALDQARDYVTDLGLAADIVVTDGFRYRLYARDRDYQPTAYANLGRLKEPAAALFHRLFRE